MSNEALRKDSIEGLFERYGSIYRWLATGTLMLGMIGTVLTATIVNVALPDIMGTFGFGQDKAQLLSTGFLAAMTGTMLLNAWLVETLGIRATYIISLVVFIVASFIGGLAGNDAALILSRVMQGGAAGILQPLTMQVIFQVFPPEKRGSAMGIYGIGVVLAPALGPALGGILVDHFSWRSVFFMAVPFALGGLACAPLFMPGPAETRKRLKFDWIGFVLMSVFLVSLLNCLSNGQRFGWHSHRIVVELGGVACTVVAFLLWELRTDAPMLNMRLFVNRTFAGGSIVAFIFGAGLYGSTYLVPLFVQTIQHYTPTRSGLLLMPAGLMLAFVFPIAGRLTDLVSSTVTLVIGLVLFSVSSWLMGSADTNTPFIQFCLWLLVGRAGLGFIMPSLNAGALRALPMSLLSQGSGAINFVRQLGAAFGVNLLSIFLEQRTELYIGAFTAAQDSANTATAELLQRLSVLFRDAGLAESLRSAGALDYLGRMIAAQGSMIGYRDSFIAIAALFVVAILPALMMRPVTPGRRARPLS